MNNDNLAAQIASEKSSTVEGNVGLLTHSDYLRANINKAQCGTDKVNFSNYKTCKNTDWLYTSSNAWWTLSPSSSNTNTSWQIAAAGDINVYAVTSNRGVRPSVYLKSSITLSGQGTKSNPYKIDGGTTTDALDKPTFTEEETNGGKDVTIHYPSGCGSTLTCTYQKDNGQEVEVNKQEVVVSFDKSGSLIATVSDGKNTVSNSYTVTIAVIEEEENISLNISTISTTNSITVVANAKADSGIAKYEYSKDGGNSWISSSYNTYTFSGLTKNTNYNIKIRVTSIKGKQVAKSTSIYTKNINVPTFNESETSSGKNITIHYPSGCGSIFTCTYQKDNRNSVTVTSSTINVSFTNSGNVVAKVTDGTNTVSSSYNVTIVKPVDITDNVVTSGDGLYKDEYENGRYVYKGTDPDNYIMFNNELWRIISKEADGTYKILRNEVLPEKMAFDSKGARTTGYCSQGNAPFAGCNAWSSTANMVGSPSEFTNGNYSGSVDADSEMLTYLNGEYLDSITVNKDKIVNHDFSIGGVTYGNNDLQSQITSENSYKWNGNIGLISVSDYLRANSDMETCGTHSTNNSAYTTCRHTNWMFNGTYWWTLSPFADPVYAYNEFFVNGDGGLYGNFARDSNGVRPAVFLSSSLSFSGSGSQSDPYRLS